MEGAERTQTSTLSRRSRRRLRRTSPVGGSGPPGNGKPINAVLDSYVAVHGAETNGASVDGDETHTPENGAKLIISDARTAYLLLDEARYRTVERLFGVPRHQSALVTVVALGMLAEALRKKTDQMLRGPGRPSLADAALGAGATRELVNGIVGSPSRDTPLAATLVAVAVIGTAFGPVLRRSIRGVGASSHRVRIMFSHRYGHHMVPRRR
jgi:hypothetical protein